jgi:hypothetical protein
MYHINPLNSIWPPTKLNLYFSPYRGKTYTVSSGNRPSFSCATSSSLLMLTAGPVSKMASQQEKAFCVLRFDVSRSVITVQREFYARFRMKTAHALPACAALQSQIWTPQNGAHRKPFPAPTPPWKLDPRLRSKHEKGLLVAYEKLEQFPLLAVYVVPV